MTSLTRRLLPIALVLLLAGAAAAIVILGRPRLHFTNRLAAPVRLSVGQGAAATVPPGAAATVPIARGRTLVAEWELVRPLSADSTPMGEEVRGSLVVRAPRGTVEGVAGTRQGASEYFAPLITNATSGYLRVTVNAGLEGALDCGCAVRPGGRRVFVGYYRLYGNSTVRARGSVGEATFRDLGPNVTTAAGTVGLRFEDKDLRPAVNRRGGGSGARPPA
ncbi:MAG: hypothetical protein H0T68_10535 [Gemmatimonadales bacterium]|nr:hypothetical protein [Gemmatimonadales bacterium]